jgi:2-hydroxy-6-oxonona-2,4-dienedioate hydrolase
VWRCWGSGPPLLLLHGAYGAWSHWIRNIDALSQTRSVWAVDLPGCGDSAMPSRKNHLAITNSIASGWRSLVQDEVSTDVVGFSFGGVVGAYLSAHHPSLVRHLILVATGGMDTPMGEVSLHRVRDLEGPERRAAIRANLLAMMLHNPTAVDDLAIHLQDINASRGRVKASPLVLPDKLLRVLPRVKASISAVWGEYDRPHPNPALQECVLRQFQPDLDFRIISDAGHWVMYEQSTAFNRILIDLLSPPRAEHLL